MSLARTFLYASKPVNDRSAVTAILSPNFSRNRSRLAVSRSGNASPIATSVTPSADDSTSSAAPVPRPPHPMRPTLIASLPAAWTAGRKSTLGATAVATAAEVAVFKKSRLVASLMLFLLTVFGDSRLDPLQIVLFFDGTNDAKPHERGIGEPPDALRALGIPAVPVRARPAARSPAQPGLVIVPRPAARYMRIPPIGRQQHRADRARREAAVGVGFIPIEAPFSDVSVHVVQTPAVRGLGADEVRM